MFRLIADQQRKATEQKLGLLLHDCVQIPRVLGEVTAFGGSNVEPSVKSCFEKAGKNKDFIEVSGLIYFFNFGIFFSFILLIHEGSHSGRSTRNPNPVMTSSAGPVPRLVQTKGSVHLQPTLPNC